MFTHKLKKVLDMVSSEIGDILIIRPEKGGNRWFGSDAGRVRVLRNTPQLISVSKRSMPLLVNKPFRMDGAISALV